MKSFVAFSALCLLATAGRASAQLPPPLEVQHCIPDPLVPGQDIAAHYVLQAPRMLPVGQDVPLLVLFRGAEGSGRPRAACPNDPGPGNMTNEHWAPWERSDLMTLAANAGWYAVAPLCRAGLNYGWTRSMAGAEHAIAEVLARYPVDRERIYAIGFSMGAANALTYAATRVDPNGPGGMIAGLMILSGVHGGTMQWSEACAGRDLLQAEIGTVTCGYGFFGDCNCPRTSTNDPVNCPGSPLNDPAAFQRSGAVFTSLCPPFVPEPGMSTVENLLHVPCWGVVDPGDGISNDEMAVLDATMQGLQGGVGHPAWTYVQNGNGSCTHCWDLLGDTLDVIGSFSPLSLQLPASARVLAPSDGWYFHFDVARANPLLAGVFRYAVSTANNRLTLSEIDNASALTVRTLGSVTPHGVDSGLDPGAPLVVRFPAPLAAGISVFLEGYAQAPAQVTRATFFGGRYALLEFMNQGVDWFWSGGTLQLVQDASNATVAWTVTP